MANFPECILFHCNYMSYKVSCRKTIHHKLTVFFNLDIGDIFNPAIMAIKLLKFPILKHSLPTSIQYSTTLTRCFFFGYYNYLFCVLVYISMQEELTRQTCVATK